jgi:magnesium/cobalt transport protein CorA
MQIRHFVHGQPPQTIDPPEHLPEQGYLWIDLSRDEAQDWEHWPKKLCDVDIDQQHLFDALTPSHISFFDGTPDYDMLIFEGLGPHDDPFPLETRSAVFFVFERLLLSVRAPDNVSFELVQQKLCSVKGKSPPSELYLAHHILDTMVDRYLRVREFLDLRLTELQDDLLSPGSNMNDWRSLLNGRRIARKLEALSEDQLEAIDAWRRGSAHDWDNGMQVRMRDLSEHVGRVRDHASGLERDLEAAVQLHFATMTHRSNEIMKIFTVVTVIFMPLTVLTGIWGMNFEFMPELHWKYGYPMALTLIVGVAIAMVMYFRRRRIL